MPEPRSSESPKPPTGRFERINYRLKHSPLIEFLEYAGKLTVVAAVISGAWSGIKWQLEADSRVKERHYRAWELINAARGSTGDGGRRDALEDLNRDGVDLYAAPLEGAYLRDVNLKGARLLDARLHGAILSNANLQDASLFSANLQGASLRAANLQGAVLMSANLRGADLSGADLRGINFLFTNLQVVMSLESANLRGADLSGADLRGVTLAGANLQGADLRGAHFEGANLQDVDLRGAVLEDADLRGAMFGIETLKDGKFANFSAANLTDASLQGANLQEARNLTQEQLDVADGDDRTVLPDGLTRPAHWSKAEATEGPSAAQPDDAGQAPAKEGAPGPDK